jgi:multiple sugar transport system permease protein
MPKKTGNKVHTFLLLLPWTATFAVFWLYPLLYAMYLSFTRYSTLRNKAVWIGADNYVQLWQDPLFWKATWNTTFFTIGTVPITIGLALGLAVALHANIRSFSVGIHKFICS